MGSLVSWLFEECPFRGALPSVYAARSMMRTALDRRTKDRFGDAAENATDNPAGFGLPLLGGSHCLLVLAALHLRPEIGASEKDVGVVAQVADDADDEESPDQP